MLIGAWPDCFPSQTLGDEGGVDGTVSEAGRGAEVSLVLPSCWCDVTSSSRDKRWHTWKHKVQKCWQCAYVSCVTLSVSTCG